MTQAASLHLQVGGCSIRWRRRAAAAALAHSPLHPALLPVNAASAGSESDAEGTDQGDEGPGARDWAGWGSDGEGGEPAIPRRLEDLSEDDFSGGSEEDDERAAELGALLR